MFKRFLSKDVLLVFFVFLLLLINRIFITCKIFYSLSFDSQTLLLWEYVVKKGMLPIRDIFYPYGFFSYFRDSSLLLRSFEIVFLSSLFTVVYIFLKRVSKNAIFAFLALALFTLLIYRNIGLEIFIRYGTTLIFIIACSYILYKNTLFNKSYSFVLGFSTALIYFFFHDQMYYMWVLYLALFTLSILDELSLKKLSLMLLRIKFFGLIYYLLGVVVGAVPFFILAFRNRIPNYFLSQLEEMVSIPLYSKTPYLSNFRHFDTIFLVSALSISIGIIWYKRFEKKQKLLLDDYFMGGISLYLCLLMQKSIVRSFDSSLVFLGVLLLNIFFIKATGGILKNYPKYLLFIIFILIELILILNFKPLNKLYYEASISEKICIEKNIQNINRYNHSYLKVVKELNLNNDNGVFVFPSDPIFYVLLNRKPVYFPSLYEMSLFRSQNKIIYELEKSKNEYIILNKDVVAVQDGVPDFIRGKNIFNYIGSNYSPYKKIDSFVILKRKTTVINF